MKTYGEKIKFAAIAVLLAAVLVAGCAQPPSGGGTPSPQPGPVQSGTPSVERSFSSATLKEGDTLTVTLKVNTAGATYYAFDEVLPEGWVAVNTSLSTEHVGHVKMVAIENAVDATFSYDVVVSGTGAKAFSGNYMFEGMAGEVPIAGTSRVTVQ